MRTVLQVGNREKLLVFENGGRKVERDSVFPQVCGCLGFVPLEFNLPVIQTPFSHITASRSNGSRGVRVLGLLPNQKTLPLAEVAGYAEPVRLYAANGPERSKGAQGKLR